MTVISHRYRSSFSAAVPKGVWAAAESAAVSVISDPTGSGK